MERSSRRIENYERAGKPSRTDTAQLCHLCEDGACSDTVGLPYVSKLPFRVVPYPRAKFPIHVRKAVASKIWPRFLSGGGRLEFLNEGVAWLALSDQVDIRLPARLCRGIESLSSNPDELPAPYCSKTRVADAALTRRRPSTRFPRPPSFRNARYGDEDHASCEDRQKKRRHEADV